MRSTAIDDYVLDTLMPDLVGHDRQPGAFLVYVYLWRQSRIARSSAVSRSLLEIAEGTGLSKRAVQSALKRLAARRLLGVHRPSITAVPEYEVQRPWSARIASA
jgi:hypothetical protein